MTDVLDLQILSDDTKRQAYDRYGNASTQEGFDPNAFAGGAGGFGGFQDFGQAFGGRPGSTGDLFESLFGGAFGGGGGGGPFGSNNRTRIVREDPIEVAVNVSFLEACNGASRRINITPVVDCHTCSGSGLKAGQKKTQCTTCRGAGQQTFQVQGMFMSTTCQTCGGEGSMIPRAARCGECEGVGRVKERKEVMVDIPAGIEDGMKIQIPGMGDMPLMASAGGQRGDLNVRVNVKASPVFRRQGTNLYHDAKVPLHVALLGGRVRIPTLEGEVEVRVREGTQNAEEAVMKGRGVKSLIGGRADRDRRGDLVVSWKVQIPRYAHLHLYIAPVQADFCFQISVSIPTENHAGLRGRCDGRYTKHSIRWPAVIYRFTTGDCEWCGIVFSLTIHCTVQLFYPIQPGSTLG